MIDKDGLIAQQQLEIENFKLIFQQNDKIKKQIIDKCCGIGQPLNDNILQFNKEQMKWCARILELVESLNHLEEEEE